MLNYVSQLKDMESSRDLTRNSCPLCGSSELTVISETPYDEIWSQLQIEWGAVISNEVQIAHTLAPSVRLQTCSNCQLQYFSPAIAGSEKFYSQLSSSSSHYYNDDKWEFDYVKSVLNPGYKVLDIGCGKGAFLRSIVDSVSLAIGIDTNPAVDGDGKETKLRIYKQSVEEFAIEHRDEFDLVSAFQVIEHLDSVMPFVRAAYRCVKPGGMLALSVPNRARRKDLRFGSLDYPPHHISRWAEGQLSMIAAQLNGELVSIAKQPLNKSQTIGALRIEELPKLLPFEFPGRDCVIKVISRLALTFPLSLAWQHLRMAERLGMYGMSMIAIIRKPILSGRERDESHCRQDRERDR